MLGSGTLTKSLTVHAASFSESAKAAIEAAGGKAEVVAAKPKWTKKAHKAAVAALEAAGKDYEKEKLAKRVANLKSKVRGTGVAEKGDVTVIPIGVC